MIQKRLLNTITQNIFWTLCLISPNMFINFALFNLIKHIWIIEQDEILGISLYGALIYLSMAILHLNMVLPTTEFYYGK